MASRTLVIGILVAAAIITGAIIAIIAPQLINPSQEAGAGQGEEVASVEAKCGKPSLVYVYNNTDQRLAGNQLVELLRRSFVQQGVSANVCSIDASSLGLELRAYPALLVYGDIPELAKAVIKDLGEYKLLDYAILVWLSENLGIKMTYKYHAKAYVVEGATDWGKAGTGLNEAVSKLEKYVLAHIDSVERISYTDLASLGVNAGAIKTFPALVLVSNDPLDDGTSYIVKVGDNTYTFRSQLAADVARLLKGGGGYEVHYKPDLEKLPGWGNSDAPVQMLIFEDYACPYCRVFYEKVYPAVKEYVENGTVRFIVADFIVHEEVRALHKLTYCLYKVTGNTTLLEQTILDIYSVFGSKGKPPSEDELLLKLKRAVGKDALSNIMDCSYSDEAEQHLAYCRQVASEIGARGTPTIVVWSSTGDIGVVVPGLPQKDELIKLIEYFASRA